MSKTTITDVEKFLEEFKTKLKVFRIIYEHREKNKQALLDLEITPMQRTQFIEKLKVENYYAGPKTDTNDLGSSDYWEFGTIIKKQDVYIKIKMGKVNNPVICISFHLAESKITYPFLTK
jgi:hypothetical protein